MGHGPSPAEGVRLPAVRHHDFLQSMYATHAAYWVAAVAIALALRHARRVLEGIAANLRAKASAP